MLASSNMLASLESDAKGTSSTDRWRVRVAVVLENMRCQYSIFEVRLLDVYKTSYAILR